MVRVLQIVNSMNRGGIENFLMNVYRKIDRNRVQFDFLVHTDKEGSFDKEIEELGGKIYYIPSRRKGLLKNRIALINFFKEHTEYKIVHQNVNTLTYITPLVIAKKYGVKKIIVHAHSSKNSGMKINGLFHKFNQERIEKIATDFWMCSELAGKWIFGEKMCETGKVKFIPNGIDCSKYIFDNDKREKVRKELKIENKFVIGHVGRFIYPKNHEFLIDIFNEYLNINSNSILLLIGDGEKRIEIENKIKFLNIQNKIKLLGNRNDVCDLLNAMDYFIFPSIYEGLPVSFIEAQANGLKCLLSENVTKQAIVTDLVTCKSINVSSKEWADVIDLDVNYERKNMSEQIKDAGFDIDSVVKNLQEIYENC